MRGGVGKPFVAVQYNILASYLGNNGNPWFLLPVNLTETERAAIVARYYERNESGEYVNTFANRFGGLLTQVQVDEVRAYDYLFQWETRGPNIKQLVVGLDADVFSLVEMDRFDEFREALSLTHDGAFAKRPRLQSLDGCSIFWRRERFELVGQQVNVTFEDWEPRHDLVHHESRVMLAVALRDKVDGTIIVFASVHLMRNPEDTGKDPMRMLEVSQMMAALSCLVKDVGAAGLVILGDFNCIPQSWTHLFLMHGWQDCPGDNKAMLGAFDKFEWEDNGAWCTTKTNARHLWVDYMFYSSRTLELNGEPQVSPCPEGPIPDAVHPSDHLPLRAAFRLSDTAALLSSCAAPKRRSAVQAGTALEL